MHKVAPLAGAWIETAYVLRLMLACLVAPLAGAWIETPYVPSTKYLCLVAPLAGAWIETRDRKAGVTVSGSLPSRERGLKPSVASPRPTIAAVAPLAGAWIETDRVGIRQPKHVVAPLAGAWIETAQAINGSRS